MSKKFIGYTACVSDKSGQIYKLAKDYQSGYFYLDTGIKIETIAAVIKSLKLMRGLAAKDSKFDSSTLCINKIILEPIGDDAVMEAMKKAVLEKAANTFTPEELEIIKAG